MAATPLYSWGTFYFQVRHANKNNGLPPSRFLHVAVLFAAHPTHPTLQAGPARNILLGPDRHATSRVSRGAGQRQRWTA
ncbi:hypothetical protein CN238_22375 [Sinorhizobium meliloti]|nr:hypothetical protein CN238_22375 [Sinorhizobium meliloti]RVH29325.1 hypothetical protein CN214_15730 [Sinorhizobium meliloti]RVH33783.1 hypothetical protein CN211_17420 [Sinorhizobium meliloti]